MKRCSKCGIEKEEIEFGKLKESKDGLRWDCKQCRKKYAEENKQKISESQKKYREDHKKEAIEYQNEYYEQNKEQILKKQKEYYLKNKDKIKQKYQTNKEHRKEYFIMYRKKNREKQTLRNKIIYEQNKEYWVEYKKIHKEKILQYHREYNKKYQEKNKKKISESYKLYREKNKTRISEYQKIYRKKYNAENREKVNICKNIWRNISDKGKVLREKDRCKRRNVGHVPINSSFEGCDMHHLRYTNSPNEQDNNIIIYVPRKLHRSIKHNGNTGKNMREVNILLLEWYLNNVSTEDRNKQAVDLYLKYCMLPEPIWGHN